MPIAISPFVRRQTPASEFSHFDGPWEEVLARVEEAFDQRRPGYREGVVLVPVPPEGFWSSLVELQPGDVLTGKYEARAPGEAPRKSTHVIGRGKQAARFVDIVLYRHDVLEEGNEASCDAEWEIIAVLARVTEQEAPMNPGTLMANHFQISGGTATLMSDSEFVAKLRESFLYWGDKALCTDK